MTSGGVDRDEVPIGFVRHDGGRGIVGFKGETGDCVTRAIAIAMDRRYREVYDDLWALDRIAAEIKAEQGKTYIARGPRDGYPPRLLRHYLKAKGWDWTPTMGIGTGCTVHLRADELPEGRLIVRLSKHVCAVIDGVLWDTHDCSRDGTRCVYGYWKPAA